LPRAGNRIARWNGASWSALGTGMAGASSLVSSLLRLPNGDLVAGGQFTTAGGVSANHIARWNGPTWSALGAGIAGMFPTVNALLLMPNNDVVAAGWFTTAGGVNVNNGFVNAVTTLPNVDLLAGGTFTTAGTASVVNVARWNGTSWSAFGGVTGGVVEFTTLANGGLAASTGFFIPSEVDQAAASGIRRVLAAIHDPASIARVLGSMGMPLAVPEQAVCRAPPAGNGFDDIGEGTAE